MEKLYLESIEEVIAKYPDGRVASATREDMSSKENFLNHLKDYRKLLLNGVRSMWYELYISENHYRYEDETIQIDMFLSKREKERGYGSCTEYFLSEIIVRDLSLPKSLSGISPIVFICGHGGSTVPHKVFRPGPWMKHFVIVANYIGTGTARQYKYCKEISKQCLF